MVKKHSSILLILVFLNIFFLLGFIFVSPALASVTCQYTPRDSEGMTIGPGYPGYVEDPSTVAREWLVTVDSEEQCSTRCEASLRVCREENRPAHCDPGRSLCGVQSGEVCTCCNEEKAVTPMSEESCNEFCSSPTERQGVKTLGDVSPATSPCSAASTTATTPTPDFYKSTPPILQIPIPGILTNFSPAQIYGEPGERYFYIPWIGEYASAIYQYTLGIVGILATVVLVWAGVVWLTAAGNAEKIKLAKEYISGALIGLVLAFGSYLILYTINPELVRFDALKLRVIEKIEWVEAVGPHELFQEETGEGTRYPTVPGPGTVDLSTFVRVDTPCLHTNSPVDPRWEEPLKRVAATFCLLRGTHTEWKILGGGYRPPEDAVKFYVHRCLFRDYCSIPTGNPFPSGVITTEGGIKVPSDPSIKSLRGNETALINALLPFALVNRPGHASGMAFDAYCYDSTYTGRQGHPKPLVPCQLLLELAFKGNGFCRLNNETWHFELNDLRATSTCNPDWVIGTVQKRGSPLTSYASCPRFWDYDSQQCING